MSDLVGRVLRNRYTVHALVGKGGLAKVYKVWDARRLTHLAMKVLREDLAASEVFLEGFEDEAQMLARLEHPNIVRFYGLERDGALVFILMDYVEGRTLGWEISDAQGPLSEERLLEVMRPVCSALGYAHNRQLVHSDMKPGNILTDQRGQVLVADFGLARAVQRTSSARASWGTPAYMAPEQVRGEPPTLQSDIYALGIVLFQMLTGQRPFTGSQANVTGSQGERVRWEQMRARPPSPQTYNPAISPALGEVVLICLAKNPARRYSSTLELLNALQATLKVENAAARRINGAANGSFADSESAAEPADRLRLAATTGAKRRSQAWPKRPILLMLGLITMIAAALLAVGLSTDSTTTSPSPAGIQDAPVPGSPTTYPVGECMSISVPTWPASITECVTSVEVLTNGRMRFNFSWTAEAPNEIAWEKGSDVGNTSMYLTDNHGHRLNAVNAGGEGAGQATLNDGETVHGWFLFPAPDSAATSFVFHDDDNHVKTRPIPRQWP